MQKFIKRQVDFIIALLSLVILSPLFFVVAFLIKIDSKGPVFFLQKRPGKDAKLFTVIKFRTMVDGAEKFGLDLNKDNPRITRFGRFLRRWHIDELPQLINILLSQMSLVGPRPPMISQVNIENKFEQKRFLVKPGLTGWAQIHGGNLLSWEERVKYDVLYVKNYSVWLDLKIFLISVWKIILLGRDLYKEKENKGNKYE
ncbi:hypothetical protein AMJ49_04205 [Parcubacteria bacterium DG_74_2]|nr:MAG: hypothetical protein AMJ49_04205 [Parcubacteria bacterium DG_74_2]